MNTHPARARALILVALAVASALCVGMILARPVLSGDVYHRYLVWNLFLAWIPFVFALVIYDRAKRVRLDAWQMMLFGAWLVFLPNAPYIVTDLIHFRERAVEPVWFDAVTYVSFACTGMLLGLVSLYLVHCAVRARLGVAVGWSVVIATSVLSGLGIYLGRFLRWNSWDVLANPLALMADLVTIARDPVGKPLAVTVLFTAVIVVAYLAIYAVAELRADPRRRA